MYLQDINDYSSIGLPLHPNSLQYVTCNNIQIHMLMNQFHSVLRTTKMLQNIGRKKNLQEIDPISMLQQW